MPDPLDPVEALRRIAEGECVTTGTVVRIPCVAERCWPCVARAALAALPAPAAEGVPEDRTPFAVPDRIAIDANGYGWRVFGHGTDDETWSMVPVNPDNTAPPQPMSWYVPASAEPQEVIDQAGIDHILAALIEVGPWEDMDDLDGEGTEASIIADSIRDLGRRLAPEGWKMELPHHALTRPRLVPEDFPIEDRPRVCNHGIYRHGCPSCDRQDPEERL